MNFRKTILFFGAAILCVFSTIAKCQQNHLADGIAKLTPGKYDGDNLRTFYSHVTIPTRVAGTTESVGYQLSSCGTTKPEGVGALFIGKVVPGESFEILSLSGADTSTVCWMIYKRNPIR